MWKKSSSSAIKVWCCFKWESNCSVARYEEIKWDVIHRSLKWRAAGGWRAIEVSPNCGRVNRLKQKGNWFIDAGKSFFSAATSTKTRAHTVQVHTDPSCALSSAALYTHVLHKLPDSFIWETLWYYSYLAHRTEHQHRKHTSKTESVRSYMIHWLHYCQIKQQPIKTSRSPLYVCYVRYLPNCWMSGLSQLTE